MKISQLSATFLEADENKYITQIDETVELKDRIVATKLALGKYDSADNYKEITKEEGDAIKAEKENLNATEV